MYRRFSVKPVKRVFSHGLALALLLAGAVALADVKPLPRAQWPTTVGEAVPRILKALGPTQRSIVANTSKDGLHLLQSEWGDDIEQLLGLNKGNTALVDATCGRPCAVDQATLLLMEASWEALQH
jgi:hypothetical protein